MEIRGLKKSPCSKCPYTRGLMRTVINPCPQCKSNGYQMYQWFRRQLSGKCTDSGNNDPFELMTSDKKIEVNLEMVDEDFLLEYLDRINTEIQKVRRAVQAIQEGVPFTEAFDKELFTEGKHDREISAALRQTTRMMHHLLKFRFSTSERPLRNWYDSISDVREKLMKQL